MLRIFRHAGGRRWIGAGCCLLLNGVALGQTSPTLSTTLQDFQQEQEALTQKKQTLVTQGATQEQLAAWRQQNAARFQAQQERTEVMAAESALQPKPQITQPNIPVNASPTLKAFLATQAALANARAQIHNQLVQSMPLTVNITQIDQMQQNETQIFRQQYAGELQIQMQRAQTIASESAQMPLPVPGPTKIPPNTTPQMAAYLTQRDQLRRERIQLWNQYLTADPSVREAAMQQWRQQNANRIQQVQQQAQNLSAADSINQN